MLHFLSGAAIGISISMPVGPIGLLCINRSLVAGFVRGLCTGAGATSVQVLYASQIILGFYKIGQIEEKYNIYAHALMGLTIIIFGMNLLKRRNHTIDRSANRHKSWFMCYVSAAALNVVNPMLLTILISTFGSVVDPQDLDRCKSLYLLTGLTVGSMAWWVLLSAFVAALGSRINCEILKKINTFSSVTMSGFGALIVVQSVFG